MAVHWGAVLVKYIVNPSVNNFIELSQVKYPEVPKDHRQYIIV